MMVGWLVYSRLTSFTPKGYVDYKNMNNKKITNNKALDKRNPPPLTVSCAPSGDGGPTVYIQTKERKRKTKTKTKTKTKNQYNLFHVQIIIPVGCQIFRRIRRIEKGIRLG
jgi:hypothetical protein